MNYQYARYYADSLHSGVTNLEKQAFFKNLKKLHGISRKLKSAENLMPLGAPAIRNAAEGTLRSTKKSLLNMRKTNLDQGGMFAGFKQKRIDKLLARGDRASRLKASGGSSASKATAPIAGSGAQAATATKDTVKKKTPLKTIKNYGLLAAGAGGIGYLSGASGRPSPGNDRYYQ